jgi:putative CocE/NonD family hydrolase
MTGTDPSKSGRVSRLGEYSGFSEPSYDGWVRTSQYVEVRDGTKLAVDVFRPTRNGNVEDRPLPVAWKAKRYLRATQKDGQLATTLLTSDATTDQSLPARKLIAHGYVLAAADMRGTGASFGTWTECSDPTSASDGYDINEWLAAQPWCDGNVGMFGASYEGRMQLNVASAAPPHLRAIMPEVSPFDWYAIIHRGGSYSQFWPSIGTHFRGCDLDPSVAPVDDDPDGLQVTEARRAHEQGNDYTATSGAMPFRDRSNAAGIHQWLERSGEALLPGIERSGVASYHTSGWFATMGLDQLLWYSNLARSATGERHRILMGPWSAGGLALGAPADKELWAVETLRFMDYWLKGIDNGIMSEPPIVYATPMSTTDRVVNEWRYADSWPLPNALSTECFFHGGPSGSVASLNDGLLVQQVSTDAAEGFDEMKVDYNIAAPTGDISSSMNRPGGEVGADFRPHDEHCLTYTTAPLRSDTEVTGHPVMHLFVSTTAADGDFVIHLEDVDDDGSSTFVTEGVLRASHRRPAVAPFYNFDAPWHSHNELDTEPVPPGEVIELSFALLPTSYRFRAGHRIRVAISDGDAAKWVTPAQEPEPLIRIYRGTDHRSRIVLPVVIGS